jgi:uncharacterized membrane protein
MNSISLKKAVLAIILIAGFVLSLYFIFDKTPRYFVFTKESYGDYFWPRANWVIVHVVCGILALVIGPFQFVPAIRNRFLNLHRWMGKTYLTSTLIGGIAGLYMASTSQIGYAYQFGLTGLAIAWIATGTMAYISIRNLNITQHREWMIRSYVVTFGFTFFRLLDEVLTPMIPNLPDRFGLLSWACWAIPLFVAEICIQAGKIKEESK